eukprot:m.182299 g.182299  ORF g.182299 m.182299 type:complete len:1104 (+) comp39293_c0_seq12:1544-4855(+)
MTIAVAWVFLASISQCWAAFTGHSLQFGRVDWDSNTSDIRQYVVPKHCPPTRPACCPQEIQGPSCKQIRFHEPITKQLDEDVHVHAAVSYKSAYSSKAFSSWIIHPTTRSVYVCMAPSGYAPHNLPLSVEWTAYASKTDLYGADLPPTIGPGEGFIGDGVVEFEDFTVGKTCRTVQLRGHVSTVMVTMRLEDEDTMMQDAMYTWVEDVNGTEFTVCVEEMQKFSGVHSDVKVDWLAFESSSFNQLQSSINVTESDSVTFYLTQGSSSDSDSTPTTFRKSVNFTEIYYEKLPPAIFVTPVSGDPNNMVVVWTESVSTTGFDLVLMDTSSHFKHKQKRSTDSNQYSVKVSYLVVGNKDPCVHVVCPLYGHCESTGAFSYICVPPKCPDVDAPVCTNDGQTFINDCFFRTYIFQTRRTDIKIHHQGSCLPFPFQPGTVVLQPNNGTSEPYACKQVKFNPHFFYPGQRLHALVTPDFRYGTKAHFVHDAATLWVESFGYNNLTICAYVAGRGERHGLTDKHAVTASYMVYQGAPSGAMSGILQLSNWWSATTCRHVPLMGFSSIPYVLVSLQHGNKDLKHDAASVWIDSVSTDSFTVCVRELQNFDGIHQDISINWLAFMFVPYTVFSDFGIAPFDVSNALRTKVDDLYCRTIDFTRVYFDPPRVFVTANRNASAVLIPSKYEDIITWVESVSRTKFRVCLKEFYPDKIDVTYAVVADACGDPEWFPHDGYCYQPNEDCKTWKEASADCTSQGGHLSSIRGLSEAFFVATLSSENTWIGLPRTVGSTDLRKWSDGTTVTYKHWLDGHSAKIEAGECVHALDEIHYFRWNSTNCTDCNSYVCKKAQDECKTGAHNCSKYADCHDEEGGFTCDCVSTHEGNGYTCRADECIAALHDCDSKADCINTETGYECDCKPGYIGDGKTCDADECALEVDDCDPAATCTNLIGSYDCSCPQEYEGDGKTCEMICPKDWNFFEGHCYKAGPLSSRSWHEAESGCRKMNKKATLVSLNSLGEQAFVNKLVTSSYYIGYHDGPREGTWRWLDGSLSSFAYWRHGQPDNGGRWRSGWWWRRSYHYGNEDCTESVISDYGKWNDLPCGTPYQRQYVCEM